MTEPTSAHPFRRAAGEVAWRCACGRSRNAAVHRGAAAPAANPGTPARARSAALAPAAKSATPAPARSAGHASAGSAAPAPARSATTEPARSARRAPARSAAPARTRSAAPAPARSAARPPVVTVPTAHLPAGEPVLTTDVVGSDFGLPLVRPTRTRQGSQVRTVRAHCRAHGGVVVWFTDGTKTPPLHGRTTWVLAPPDVQRPVA